MKKIFRLLIALTVATSLFSCNKNQNIKNQKTEPIFKSSVNNIQKYGNVVLNGTGDDFLKSGFEYGDIVNVNINNADYELPVVSNYSDVEQGKYLCRVGIDTETKLGSVILAINMGDFATSTGVASKNKIDTDPGFKWDYNIQEPIYATITMKEKAGYYEKYISSSLGLKRSDERDDYPNLSDEEFANFRMIKTSNIKDGIVKAIKFIGENEGPYLIHCNEGKDRAGYMSAIIECMMGATGEEVVKDYMITYYNYYGVTENDKRYDAIKSKKY